MNILKRTLTLATASIFLATGCAQLQNVPLARTAQGAERGERDRIAYADMQSLGVQKQGQMHFSKTALIVGAVVLGAVAVGAASGGGGSGGY
ncbi:MAG: hypothetical protein K0Q92_1819 [Steroidobacteraceae bacterium]|nr:hypothetical protein [Steroidobacteraceae bacterium]